MVKAVNLKKKEKKITEKNNPLMPVLFIGHGSPMNAIEKNEFSIAWKKIAKEIPTPKAILCISAHWYGDSVKSTAMKTPNTIHDFYGFPEKLNKAEYSAPGSPELAKQVQSSISTSTVKLDHAWGLDHGTWSVLMQMYPEANIPVVQLSIDELLPLQKHFDIGQELKILRQEGILIIGSGNVVHNLGMMKMNGSPYAWAVEFDAFVKECVMKKDYNSLIEYERQASAEDALPTNEHYLPLLYVLGASEGEEPFFFCEKIVLGSVSMTSVAFGMKKSK